MQLIKPEYENKYREWAKEVFRNTDTITNAVGKGFRSVSEDINDLIDYSKIDKDAFVLVLNDFDLTQTKKYYEHGITNVVLLTTDLTDNQVVNNYFFNIRYKKPKFKELLVDGKLPWVGIIKLVRKQKLKVTKKGKLSLSKTGDYQYEDYLDVEGDTQYMAKTFGAITSNPPFGLGNEITTWIIDRINFVDEQFANVMPISKYKKGTLTQHIVLGSIKNNTRARETSEFEGADTYPIICRLSKNKTNNLSFEDFERQWCVNREEGLGKKFFEEQDRRIAAEEAGTRKKAFVGHLCVIHEKDYSSIKVETAVSTAHWTPNIAHGWGAQEIYSDATTQTLKSSSAKGGNYVDWNFRKTAKPYAEVFTVTSTGINQTVTIMNTGMGKTNMLKWMHSAEMSGKYRHCGLFTILLRWMNKTTGCPYDYIIPRVDWDSRAWTDEEILKDYGYTDEEIETILHYNDDLIPASWLKKKETK
jgi:hypothetical protein